MLGLWEDVDSNVRCLHAEVYLKCWRLLRRTLLAFSGVSLFLIYFQQFLFILISKITLLIFLFPVLTDHARHRTDHFFSAFEVQLVLLGWLIIFSGYLYRLLSFELVLLIHHLFESFAEI